MKGVENMDSMDSGDGTMVRVFELVPAQPPRFKAYIGGEGIGYLLANGTIDASCSLNHGVESTICTYEQLMARSDGRRALLAWRSYDDSEAVKADQVLKEETDAREQQWAIERLEEGLHLAD